MFRVLRLAVLSSLIVAVGCGSKGPKLAKVSGRVTFDNQPLSGAHVVFRPVGADGKPDPSKESSAITDDQGHYDLKSAADNREGALPGSHRVEIKKIERTQEGIRDLLPAQYNQLSTLKFTVPEGGTSDANFELNSKGK